MNQMRIGGAAPAGVTRPDELGLRKVAQELEGVFVEQLFKAMRETVPEGGLVDGGAGEEMFSGLMDQHLAASAPAGWESGLRAALLRQLRGATAAPPPAPGPTNSGGEL